MFKCQGCGSTDFRLTVEEGCKASVEIEHNAFNEVLIKINNDEFIADLPFMNQFAVCQSCNNIKCWDYFFEEKGTTV